MNSYANTQMVEKLDSTFPLNPEIKKAFLNINRKEFVPEDFPTFGKTCDIFFSKNNFDMIYVSKNDYFLKPFLKILPKNLISLWKCF